jgi:transcriptional regulator with XRE-family HTH domain
LQVISKMKNPKGETTFRAVLLGKRLSQLRQQRDLSFGSLLDRLPFWTDGLCELSVATLFRFEQGDVPKVLALIALADTHQVKVSELMKLLIDDINQWNRIEPGGGPGHGLL